MTGNETKVVFGGQTMVHARICLDESTTPVAIDYLNVGPAGRPSRAASSSGWAIRHDSAWRRQGKRGHPISCAMRAAAGHSVSGKERAEGIVPARKYG